MSKLPPPNPSTWFCLFYAIRIMPKRFGVTPMWPGDPVEMRASTGRRSWIRCINDVLDICIRETVDANPWIVG